MKIKVCGMRDPDNLRLVAGLNPDFLGFVFYPQSPRMAKKESIAGVVQALRGIRKVGVFVDAPASEMIRTGQELSLDLIQMHGHESPETAKKVRSAGFGIIKVWHMARHFDFKELNPFIPLCDYFLFDTAGKGYGGTGKKFNWDQLEEYNGEKPFFISGGIGLEDIPALRRLRHPGLYAIDVNSRMETSPGIKDPERIKQFMKGITHA